MCALSCFDTYVGGLKGTSSAELIFKAVIVYLGSEAVSCSVTFDCPVCALTCTLVSVVESVVPRENSLIDSMGILKLNYPFFSR